MSEADVTVLGEKGQVVIPKRVRERLKLTPKTKFLVYGYRDTVMLKKLELPDVKEELESLWAEMDKMFAGKRRPTEEEIVAEVHRYRAEKRRGAKAGKGERQEA